MIDFNALLGGYGSVSIIGMCKNAGKTTVLNRMTGDFTRGGIRLGLTSIGRDGEATDLVTGTDKPSIYVPCGTLIATAAGLLAHCDITREILINTGIPTPIGDVIVLRALSDGNVQIAGPSMVDQLVTVSELFNGLGAEKVIIDGAISRKTLCSRAVSEATVLCAGASCGKNMQAVAEDTAHHCRMLRLPELNDKRPVSMGVTGRITIFTGEAASAADGATLAESLRTLPDADLVFFDGALSDHVIKSLITSGVKLKGITFAVRDASRILLSKRTAQRLEISGAKLRVLENVNLTAVAINPFSAYGYSFDKEAFFEVMSGVLDLPVINVEDEQ